MVICNQIMAQTCLTHFVTNNSRNTGLYHSDACWSGCKVSSRYLVTSLLHVCLPCNKFLVIVIIIIVIVVVVIDIVISVTNIHQNKTSSQNKVNIKKSFLNVADFSELKCFHDYNWSIENSWMLPKIQFRIFYVKFSSLKPED